MKKEIRENKCVVMFDCKGFSKEGSECVYFIRDGNNCKHAGYTTTGFCCNSAIAQAKTMILKLRELGIDPVDV